MYQIDFPRSDFVPMAGPGAGIEAIGFFAAATTAAARATPDEGVAADEDDVAADDVCATGFDELELDE